MAGEKATTQVWLKWSMPSRASQPGPALTTLADEWLIVAVKGKGPYAR